MSGAGFFLDLTGASDAARACWPAGSRTAASRRRHGGGCSLSISGGTRRAPPTSCRSPAITAKSPRGLKGCPSGAYEKRPDGVVVHHEELCLGCRYCEMTCPFATPTYDEASGVVSKCHLCAHRLDAGRLPACVAACPTEALQYAASPEAQVGSAMAFVPGFVDPAG